MAVLLSVDGAAVASLPYEIPASQNA